MSGLSEVQESSWTWQGRTGVARAPWFSGPSRFVVTKVFYLLALLSFKGGDQALD